MFVCAQLSPPVVGEPQQCLLWAESAPVLPPLSLEQGAVLSAMVLTLFAVAWGLGAAVSYLLNKE